MDVISAHVEPTFIQDIYCDSVVAQITKVTQAVLIRTSLYINKHLYKHINKHPDKYVRVRK